MKAEDDFQLTLLLYLIIVQTLIFAQQLMIQQFVLEAVLHQRIDNECKLISSLSKNLSDAETRYGTLSRAHC